MKWKKNPVQKNGNTAKLVIVENFKNCQKWYKKWGQEKFEQRTNCWRSWIESSIKAGGFVKFGQLWLIYNKIRLSDVTSNVIKKMKKKTFLKFWTKFYLCEAQSSKNCVLLLSCDFKWFSIFFHPIPHQCYFLIIFYTIKTT